MKKIITLISILICVQTTYAQTTPDKQFNYYAVFDGGSSGTRIYLYKKSKHNPKLIAFANNNIQLDTYVESATYTTQNNLLKLLNELQPKMTELGINKNNLEVNILATAGMRYAPIEKQTPYYNQIKEQLIAQGYHVNQARTISGNEEAMFSWMSANLLNKTLDTNKQTNGIIEVGGASAQIAFATPQESGANIYQIITPNQKYNVYNISFLGLGKNALYRTLIKNNESTICAANQNDYTQCGNALTEIIRSYPETMTVQNTAKYYDTNFYGIDNIKHYKSVLNKDFNPELACKNIEAKNCAENIYINQLITILKPTHLKPVNKINSKKMNWTAGFVYTTANNVTIHN